MALQGPGAARQWSRDDLKRCLSERHMLVREVERSGFRRLLVASVAFVGEALCGTAVCAALAHARAPPSLQATSSSATGSLTRSQAPKHGRVRRRWARGSRCRAPWRLKA
jgi:hypothetical protein